MRAVHHDIYGGPEVISIREVPVPVPAAGEVLLKVHAASVNSWDFDNLRGRGPRLSRIPRRVQLGADVAGVVQAVGPGVTAFKTGDAVFGDLSASGWGAFADYVAAAAKVLVRKPDDMSFEDAAAIPQAGLLALQGLRKRSLRLGDEVLINGAGGGVGTFAIQLAKAAGARVTAVDTAAKIPLMRRLGADHALDYRMEDFARLGRRFDLILDVVGNRAVPDYLRALQSGGRLVLIGGTWPTLLSAVFIGAPLSPLLSRRIGLLLYRVRTADLEEMKALYAAGTVRPVIDKVYELAEVAEALRHLGDGRALGKVLVRP